MSLDAPDALSPAPPRWKPILVLVLALGSFCGALFVHPIPQDPAYHRFADGRTMFGIPNFLNVASNLPFLVAGALGMGCVLASSTAFWAPWVRWPWLALTGSVFLTGLGSSYYHWNPTDSTLFWDRLPMAIGFGSVLGITVIERMDVRLGKALWAPLVLAGAGSLLYWRLGGDLRFYGLFQSWAIVLVLLMLLLFPARYTGTHHWFLILGLYGIAKVFEVGDAAMFRLGGFVSGHTVKHLFAAAASGLIYWHLRTRAPASELNRRDAPAAA
jgi:hypothetical protein